MPTTYTPTSPAYHVSSTLPSDGDAANAASVDSPLEAALDNAAFVKLTLGYQIVAFATASSTAPLSLTAVSPGDTALVDVATPAPLTLAAGDVVIGVVIVGAGGKAPSVTNGGALLVAGCVTEHGASETQHGETELAVLNIGTGTAVFTHTVLAGGAATVGAVAGVRYGSASTSASLAAGGIYVIVLQLRPPPP